MDSSTAENMVLYDWLSFTSKKHKPEELIFALGLEHCPWQNIQGARGYRDRKFFSSISIHYNGRADMGVWVELSGQGCRTFETLSSVGWDCLFQFIRGNGLKITRLDVAFDDHTDILDINEIVQDTLDQNYISKSDEWDVHLSSKGKSVVIGSPRSRVLIRIYDKAAERGKDGEHWVRCELQLRDDRAIQFSALGLPIGEAYTGVLLNYLRYVVPGEDVNRWRWPMTEYWRRMVEDVERISIYQSPGMEYNEERCRNYVVNQAGNAIDACIQMYGLSDFKEMIDRRETRKNPKYDELVKRHNLLVQKLPRAIEGK